MDGSYRFEGYGASVRIDVPEYVTPSQLCSLVAPEVTAEECWDGPSDLNLTRWNGDYHLVYGERRYGPYRDTLNALRGVANAIHFILGKKSPLTFLHAGAVEIDGAAVVFPARSRWGKSELVSALVKQGCGYLSDEYAVVSPEGAVFPLSKPIRMRKADGAEYLTPDGTSAPGGLSCAALILTRYEKEATWDPSPMTPGHAALETIPSALQSSENPEQVLQAVVSLVREAACYQGVRGNLEPTAEGIRRLLGEDDVVQEARAR